MPRRQQSRSLLRSPNVGKAEDGRSWKVSERDDPANPEKNNNAAPVLVYELNTEANHFKGFNALIDIMQVLVLTDLELCYWPPGAEVSQEEAQCAISQLAPAARRRGILAAQRLLRRVEARNALLFCWFLPLRALS
eukprot:symbB.v1.2.002220.t1/scaffold119.1/size318073/18